MLVSHYFMNDSIKTHIPASLPHKADESSTVLNPVSVTCAAAQLFRLITVSPEKLLLCFF